MPGVPLIAGLQTGMTRSEVKRIVPRLSAFESRQKLELLPGLALKAWAGFKNVFGPLETIGLSGTAAQAPGDALTKHFGLPIRLDGGTLTMANPGTTMPAVLISRYSVEKWCDGPRVFILNLDEDRFTLTLSGPRTKP